MAVFGSPFSGLSNERKLTKEELSSWRVDMIYEKFVIFTSTICS
jgi:hypothetical protein